MLGLFLHSTVDDSDLTVYEFRVYAHLCRRAGDERRVWEGQKKIALNCKMSRAAAQKALYGLEEKGWIELHERYREDGSQGTNNIIICGPPASVEGTPRLPEMRPPPLRKAAEGNPREGNPNKVIQPHSGELILPDWLPEELWGEWLQHRAEKKSPVTPTSARMLFKKLEGAKDKGHDPVSLVETAIARGWLGIVIPDDSPSKSSAGGRRPQNSAQANQQAADRASDIYAALQEGTDVIF